MGWGKWGWIELHPLFTLCPSYPISPQKKEKKKKREKHGTPNKRGCQHCFVFLRTTISLLQNHTTDVPPMRHAHQIINRFIRILLKNKGIEKSYLEVWFSFC